MSEIIPAKGSDKTTAKKQPVSSTKAKVCRNKGSSAAEASGNPHVSTDGSIGAGVGAGIGPDTGMGLGVMQERRRKRKNLLSIGIVLILLLSASAAAVYFSSWGGLKEFRLFITINSQEGNIILMALASPSGRGYTGEVIVEIYYDVNKTSIKNNTSEVNTERMLKVFYSTSQMQDSVVEQNIRYSEFIYGDGSYIVVVRRGDV
ncbi:MAG: hypothetical protein QW728_06285, partial [Thermoplasmata archaeon]